MQPTLYHTHSGKYPRDYSRSDRAKSAAQARKRARRAKSATMFLCWAFPAETLH